MNRKRIAALEARIEELEAKLNPRTWELPPRNDIPLEDLPSFPDYSVSCWTEDLVEAWNPTGYR